MSNEGGRREYSPKEDMGEIVDVEAETTPEAGTPEAVIGIALTAVENRDGADVSVPQELLADIKSWFADKQEKGEAVAEKITQKKDELVKEYPKVAYSAGLAVDAGRVGTILVFKILGGLLKFAKTAITKKGKISMKEGWDIGKEMFSFDNKKDKK